MHHGAFEVPGSQPTAAQHDPPEAPQLLPQVRRLSPVGGSATRTGTADALKRLHAARSRSGSILGRSESGLFVARINHAIANKPKHTATKN